MNHSFKKEYKTELTKLREESKIFSQHYPEIAPMLGEKSSDPDTERLLEGVAYLNAIIQKRLNDDFPEILHELVNILFPYYLKPTPSLSVVQFTPEKSLNSSVEVKKRTLVKAKPYNNIQSQFQTTWSIDILPLSLESVSYLKTSTRYSELELFLTVSNQKKFSSIDVKSLDFFISDTTLNAFSLASLLSHSIKKIEIFENNKKIATLPITELINLGFDSDYGLFPFNNNALNNYKLLQEYFIFSEKFMFFKLSFNKLENVEIGSKFSIKFSFDKFYDDIHGIVTNSVRLYCVPVINIFEDNCEPIKLQNISSSFELTPSWKYRDEFRIYDVLSVDGIAQGKKEVIPYYAFDQFSKNVSSEYLYKIVRKKSQVSSSKERCYLELFRTRDTINNEVLSISVSVTNGRIPENLAIGDICISSSSSPERCTFQNITLPTSMIETPLENNVLWFLISHATTNILTIDSLSKLKDILSFYMGHGNKDKAKIEINTKKINSLSKFDIEHSTYLHKGSLLKGMKLNIHLSSEYFFNIGDMNIFLEVIHKFYTVFCSINSFVELEAYDTLTGERFECKPKLGIMKTI